MSDDDASGGNVAGAWLRRDDDGVWIFALMARRLETLMCLEPTRVHRRFCFDVSTTVLFEFELLSCSWAPVIRLADRCTWMIWSSIAAELVSVRVMYLCLHACLSAH